MRIPTIDDPKVIEDHVSVSFEKLSKARDCLKAISKENNDEEEYAESLLKKIKKHEISLANLRMEINPPHEEPIIQV